MTHSDLCTCIALTKWDGPVASVNVTENVENFQSKFYHFTATQTSVTVSVKQHEHDRVTLCSFSVDFKEIKTISQPLLSTCAICLQRRQSGRHREEIEIRAHGGDACVQHLRQTWHHHPHHPLEQACPATDSCHRFHFLVVCVQPPAIEMSCISWVANCFRILSGPLVLVVPFRPLLS